MTHEYAQLSGDGGLRGFAPGEKTGNGNDNHQQRRN
jgi:hypothetical protein